MPEPSTLVLACLGGVLACWVARRRAGQAIL
ncbi:MAG: PEP-CTERM sorting domain-containing protein [Brevundimonas sp.]